jgi:uncharacterized protein YjbJ (UPF0337 family)
MRIQTILLTAAAIAGLAAGLGACDTREGSGQKTKGQIESAAGSLTGNAKLKQDGRKDQVVGGVKNTLGDLKAVVHDAGK